MEPAQVSYLATRPVFFHLQSGNDGIGGCSFLGQWMDAVSSGTGHPSDPFPTSLFVSRTNTNFQCMVKMLNYFFLSVCLFVFVYSFFLAIISFLPESPRWLLLNKRMNTLEGYQNRSPEDKHCLGLVRQSHTLKLLKCLWKVERHAISACRIVLT